MRCPRPRIMISMISSRWCARLACAGLILAAVVSWSDTVDAQHVCTFQPPDPAAALAQIPDRAAECDPAACLPPGCLCPSTAPPGGLAASLIPQFVLLTFDDCVESGTQSLIDDLVSTLENPDGRPLPATYFVSVRNCWETFGAPTDAALLFDVYQAGNEVANHTTTHLTGNGTSLAGWLQELREAETFFITRAGIPAGHVRGFRAPYAATNDDLYRALTELGYLYDSSLFEQPLFDFSVSTGQDSYVWPHTLDYATPVSCGFFPGNYCPSEAHPGLWTVPLYYLTDPRGQAAPGDSLYYGAFDPGAELSGGPALEGEQLLSILRWNFDQRYSGNRAPFNLYLHASQMTKASRRGTLRQFMGEILARPDVWFVTMTGLIEWMQDPVPAHQMAAWYESYCTRYPCAEADPDPLSLRRGEAVAFPNPARTHTTIAYRLDESQLVHIDVFDRLGRPVASNLVDGQRGVNRLELDVSHFVAGIYFYRIETVERVISGRFTRL